MKTNDAKNYRGITVLTVILKIIEFILRKDLKDVFDTKQSPLQRGFTSNSSPLNCAFLVEEFYRESKDLNKPVYTATLDAKSAFDVVSNEILMRKVYNYNIAPTSWTLIDDLDTNSYSAVKWNGHVSSLLEISQGVKQGGLLSADLYKVYGEDLLHQLQFSNVGGRIGCICLNAAACAEDVVLLSNSPGDLQILIGSSVTYSGQHRYILQPQKSVVKPGLTHKSSESLSYVWKMGEKEMPTVE